MPKTAVRILCAMGLVALRVWSQAWSPGPVPVSPGGSAAEELTAEACPTFHWAEALDAGGYELIVHRTEGVDATRLEAVQELGETLDAPALHQILPAGTSSWTPSLDRCLEPGGRYAWTVGVTEERGAGAVTWAEAQHFVVRDQSRLERILDEVVHRLLEEGELTEEDVEQLATWGLGGDLPPPPVPLVPDSAVDAGVSEAPPELRSLTAAGSAPVSAAFQVDGTGYTYGVYAEGAIFATTPASNAIAGLSESILGIGVLGLATADFSTTAGVKGQTHSIDGSGVFGRAEALSGLTYGVRGVNLSTSGRGVYGLATAGSGKTYGVRGTSHSSSGTGVHGNATSSSGVNYGVSGESASSSGVGVRGLASDDSGIGIGVLGESSSVSGYDFFASGLGINYGAFTGGHEVRLEGDADDVMPGLVVSVTGRAEVRRENDTVNLSSTLPTVTLSCHANDPAVFGVLVAESELSEDHWYQPADGERFATVNALGEGRVWVTDANGPVHAGDYLTTSHVPGYAQRQGDRYLQSHTLGKTIETVDWDAVTETVEHDGVTYRKALVAVVYTSG